MSSEYRNSEGDLQVMWMVQTDKQTYCFMAHPPFSQNPEDWAEAFLDCFSPLWGDETPLRLQCNGDIDLLVGGDE